MASRAKPTYSGRTKKFYSGKRKKPLVLVFDEKAREDFLTGFHKRKLQRKKKAQEQLEIDLKAERKRIRLEAKNALKNLVVSHRDIPELEHINNDADVVDMDTHQVHITELDTAKLARDNNWIGENKVQYNKPKEEPISEDESEDNEIVGMEINKKPKEAPSKINTSLDFKTQKDVKKYIKQVATKTVKQSKVFQKKKDIEQIKNKKKKRREEKKNEKKKKIKSKREKHKKRR